MLSSVVEDVRKRLGRFRADEDGGMTAFSVVTFLTMFVAVGMGMDFMRHEAHRAELQDAIDRGILAAATFTDGTDAKATVAAYLRSGNYIDDEVNLVVVDNPTMTSNSVTATASYNLRTFFLKLVGIPELQVFATGTAIQGLSNIEVSLVLDISGSMARERTTMTPAGVQAMNDYEYPSALTWGGDSTNVSRLDLMRVASSDFVDQVLTNANQSSTSISLVPFAGNVNIGATAFDALHNGTRVHSHSSCIDLVASDYTDTDLPANNSALQTEHFQWYRFEADYGHNAEWGWCPSDDQSIVYMSNNLSFLKQRISEFVAHDGTGTQNAMKWGLALLDSATNPLIQALVAAGEVDAEFDDRPASFTSNDVLKVIVLMSDGNTTEQMRVRHSHYQVDDGDGVAQDDEMEWWADNALGEADGYIVGTTFSESDVDQATARSQLLALCQMAKDEEVIVFTIGFDIAEDSYAHMDLSQCASSASHFFDVNGDGLTDAFAQIATTISKLRLIH